MVKFILQGSWTLFLDPIGEKTLEKLGFYVPPRAAIGETWVAMKILGENKITEVLGLQYNSTIINYNVHVQLYIPLILTKGNFFTP